MLTIDTASNVDGYAVLDGERYLKIASVDVMPEFFMSLVGASDHWMFVTSYGAVTAGRKNPDNALFPYAPDEQLSIGRALSGPRTIIRKLTGGDSFQVWRPLHNYEHPGKVVRNLYKTPLGNKLVFEEIDEEIGLSFRYRWTFSDRFGFVRTCCLQNVLSRPVALELVDGLAGVLPAGLDAEFPMRFGNLANAYKSSELVDISQIGLAYLSSLPTDRAEPNEGLRASTVWQTGLAPSAILLSEDQLPGFAAGTHSLQTESRSRGRRCAYLTAATLQLEPGASATWHVVAEVGQDHCDIVNLDEWLQRCELPACELEQDIQRSERALLRIVASTDGLQCGQNAKRCDRHLGNTVFNAMRGGVPLDSYRVSGDDFRKQVAKANREIERDNAAILDELPSLTTTELGRRLDASGEPGLVRLGMEYLPLAFSRRHGDPTRPWNRFSIDLRTSDGKTSLNYQGNWRDIFQNWEALAFSFPQFLPNMICRFVNATTADGYNPYRVTKDGFEWEEPEPDNPWSNIGYWGDHQIIYLLKLLESCQKAMPWQLEQLLARKIFAHANVPYRLKPFEEIVRNPHETIDFDFGLARKIQERSKDLGADAKLLAGADGKVLHVSLLEKILTLTLAKLANFVPSGGIWMNTQRPEWNDANNALVGNGLSVVTACYLHRWCIFLRDQLQELSSRGAAIETRVSAAVGSLTHEIASILAANQPGEQTTAQGRRVMCEQLGQAASQYRKQFYAEGLTGTTELDLEVCIGLFDRAVKHLRATIDSNRRPDGLYHSYNLMTWTDDGVYVDHLSEMLEGQVAVLCSDALSSQDAVALLEALRKSGLYRADQDSYLLYPDRELPRFQEKNQVATEAVMAIPMLRQMLEAGDTRVIRQDARGVCHFNSTIRNAAVLRETLTRLPASEQCTSSSIDAIIGLYESTFNHRNFTGRSGTFFAYEGLGSIYWHMVSKLRLAVAEAYLAAVDDDADSGTLAALKEKYEAIRLGIGAEKTPEQYGAFPSDPYSHTPEHAGAKQPGMTGQVKEDFLARFVELGAGFKSQQLHFRMELFDRSELTAQPQEFSYVDLDGEMQSILVPENAFAMLICQVPVVYHADSEGRIEVTLHDGLKRNFDTMHLDVETTSLLISRNGAVKRVDCFFTELTQ